MKFGKRNSWLQHHRRIIDELCHAFRMQPDAVFPPNCKIWWLSFTPLARKLWADFCSEISFSELVRCEDARQCNCGTILIVLSNKFRTIIIESTVPMRRFGLSRSPFFFFLAENFRKCNERSFGEQYLALHNRKQKLDYFL